MFNTKHKALYKFRYNGVTHYVIEDDPRNDYVKVRNVHGTIEFPKDELQRLIENDEVDISCD